MTKEEFKQRILIKGTPTNPPTTNKAPLTAYPASINWA